MIFAVDCLWNLINKKINVTPLHSAARRGYIEIVQLLLAQKGIKINCTALIIHYLSFLWNIARVFYFTPLIWAVQTGQKEIVQLLLAQEGINITIKDI